MSLYLRAPYLTMHCYIGCLVPWPGDEALMPIHLVVEINGQDEGSVDPATRPRAHARHLGEGRPNGS